MKMVWIALPGFSSQSLWGFLLFSAAACALLLKVRCEVFFPFFFYNGKVVLLVVLGKPGTTLIIDLERIVKLGLLSVRGM